MSMIGNLKRFAQVYKAPMTNHFNKIQEFGQSIRNGSGHLIPLWQLIQAAKISFEVEKELSL